MIEPAPTAAILLAAGASTRFGGDKLAASVGGETVLALSARALAASGCALRAAVLSPVTKPHAPLLQTLGFAVVLNERADDGLSASIRAGVDWADKQGAQSVLIALGDMPFIDPEHYLRLLRKFQESDDQLTFTVCGDRRAPPAIFGSLWFSPLRNLHGDAGARDLLRCADKRVGVQAPASALRDIDTPGDLI